MRIVNLTGGLDSRQIEAALRNAAEEVSVDAAVTEIVSDVRTRGDAALCDYSQRFDRFELTPNTRCR